MNIIVTRRIYNELGNTVFSLTRKERLMDISDIKRLMDISDIRVEIEPGHILRFHPSTTAEQKWLVEWHYLLLTQDKDKIVNLVQIDGGTESMLRRDE